MQPYITRDQLIHTLFINWSQLIRYKLTDRSFRPTFSYLVVAMIYDLASDCSNVISHTHKAARCNTNKSIKVPKLACPCVNLSILQTLRRHAAGHNVLAAKIQPSDQPGKQPNAKSVEQPNGRLIGWVAAFFIRSENQMAIWPHSSAAAVYCVET